MITIVTAGGTTVDLATVDSDGTHYPIYVPGWAPLIEAFPLAARAYTDPAADPWPIEYCAPIAMPTTEPVMVWAYITDWGHPGADTPDIYSELSFYVEVSLNGTDWMAVTVDPVGQSVESIRPVDMNPYAFESGVAYPPYPFYRFGWTAEVGTGGDFTTDQITFSLFVQPGAGRASTHNA